MNNAKHVRTFFSLSLLFVFAICAFALLFMQIQGYQAINEQSIYMEQTHTPISYIRNKVRQFDQQGRVAIQRVNGQDCLVLKSEDTQTYIYVKDGYLQEIYGSSNYQPSLIAGEKIFACKSMSMKWEKDTLVLQFDFDKSKKEIHIQVRSQDNE